MKQNTSLFITGFSQVSLVALNTLLLAKQVIIGVVIVSFLISFIWSFNVKKVAFGSMRDRLVYSAGASVGGLTGLFIGGLI